MRHRDELRFLERLDAETAEWQREELITPLQRERIMSRCRASAAGKSGDGRLATTISVLGALLVGIGFLLFVASNWSAIPVWGRLAVIFTTLSASYGAGFHLRYDRRDYPRVGDALILTGALIFGAGIFLVAQMYHISVHYPNGPLLWGVGILPLAYLLKHRGLLFLALGAFLVWLGTELRFWVTKGPEAWMQTTVVYLMAGTLLWVAGLAQRGSSRLRELAEPYIVIGALVTFSGCFILTFDVYRQRLGSPSLLPFYSAIAILFISSLVARVYARRSEKLWEAEILALMAVMGAALYLAISYRGGGGGAFYLIAVNLLFGGGVIGIIVMGYLRSYPFYVNVGLVFFVLDVLARYFDFFWKMLPRSLFFIIGGIILLGGGSALERKRRRIMTRLTADGGRE